MLRRLAMLRLLTFKCLIKWQFEKLTGFVRKMSQDGEDFPPKLFPYKSCKFCQVNFLNAQSRVGLATIFRLPEHLSLYHKDNENDNNNSLLFVP